MAFVILSAGTLTRPRTRTFSLGAFAMLLAILVVAALAGGYWLGHRTLELRPVLDQPEAVAVPESVLPAAAPERAVIVSDPNRHLIDRFGELAGRVIHLEAEAVELAARIGAIAEFEARIKPEETADVPLGRAARTQPGAPSGGPLLRPLEDDAAPKLDEAALADDFDAGEALGEDFVRLESDIARLSTLLASIDEAATSLNHAHMSFPGRTPVRGVAINSSFGNRVDPISRRRAFHSGVDYAAPRGTPIHASAGGRVIFAGNRRHYGLTVEIDHGAGLVTRYAHASRLLVSKGQVVMPGEEIARVGATGRTTGPHLHFEILKDGHFVDPSLYLARF